MIQTQKNKNLVEDLHASTKANIDFADLLDQIESLIKNHTILPEAAISAVTLWCAATYVINDFRVFPKLLITSPEKRCGKSTLLTLIKTISNKAFMTANITAPTIYRLINQCQPSLIIDEADTFVANSMSDMTGIINSGHCIDTAKVTRCSGDNHEPHTYSTWSPMVLASIGDLQSTIMDRSIVIQIRRKKTSEKVSVIPIDLFDHFKQVREELLKWSMDNSSMIKSNPVIPPDIGNDRAADNWTPLFSIAALANSDWLTKCSQAYTALNAKEELAVSTMLLSDIQPILIKSPKLASADLVAELIKDKDKLWCEYNCGRPITQSGLAKILNPYGIKPKSMRIGTQNLRGYKLSQFTDTFERYLNP